MDVVKRKLSWILNKPSSFWKLGAIGLISISFSGLLVMSVVHTLSCEIVHFNLAYILFKNKTTPQKMELEKLAKKIPAVKKQEVVKKPKPTPSKKIKSFKVKKLSLAHLNKQVESLELNTSFDRRSALKDPENLIGKDFKVPHQLRFRVGFWFDIYTIYGSEDHVFHHAKYPWIILDVFNTKYIDKQKGHHWTKYHRKKKAVKSHRYKIKKALKRLAKRKHYRNLKGLDKKLYNALKNVGGKRSRVIRVAAANLRTQVGQRDYMLKGIINSRKYLPYMEEIFEKENLPLELTRMPFVESSFNENAFSKVGASGIWQIMPRSAKDGLTVNRHIDERNSPLKATQYAAKHLKRDYRILKKWPLAITAYNHGIGNLRRAKRKMRTSNIITLIARYSSPAFQFASRNFYTSFIAVLHAEAYHKKIFQPLETLETPEIELVKIKRSLRVKKLLAQLEMTPTEFFHLNLDLKKTIEKNRKIPKGLKIVIPRDKRHQLDPVYYSENLLKDSRTI